MLGFWVGCGVGVWGGVFWWGVCFWLWCVVFVLVILLVLVWVLAWVLCGGVGVVFVGLGVGCLCVES
ncbi:hypothetical protein, partial [Pseudomonas syringae group genomosp. 7]|uniref:hypothetical protein n=1 Tax=Pseudomonas syringae group genomosp. 7 TaxID=251699 RepID=UPI00377046C6